MGPPPKRPGASRLISQLRHSTLGGTPKRGSKPYGGRLGGSPPDVQVGVPFRFKWIQCLPASASRYAIFPMVRVRPLPVMVRRKPLYAHGLDVNRRSYYIIVRVTE